MISKKYVRYKKTVLLFQVVIYAPWRKRDNLISKYGAKILLYDARAVINLNMEIRKTNFKKERKNIGDPYLELLQTRLP